MRPPRRFDKVRGGAQALGGAGLSAGRCSSRSGVTEAAGNVVLDVGAEIFDEAAAAYERGRPSYAEEGVAYLVGKLGIGSGSTVVDLAAGTGKLTRMLVPTGATMVAVEPVEGMRRQLLKAVPEAIPVAATAEAMPLADASVDAVTVATAFHWFRGEDALAEIHRVLRPGGRLGLVVNSRDRSVEWVAGLSAILDECRERQWARGKGYASELGETRRRRTPALSRYGWRVAPAWIGPVRLVAARVRPRRKGSWRKAFSNTSLFLPLEDRYFPYQQELDVDTLVDRVASISYVAGLPDEERHEVLERVRGLVSGMPPRFVLPYRTRVTWCTRR
jgi:SAM-dependent methyltransferase